MVSSIAVTPKDSTASASPHTKQVSKAGVYRTLKQRTKRDMHVCNDSGIQNEEGIKGKVRNRGANAQGGEKEKPLGDQLKLFETTAPSCDRRSCHSPNHCWHQQRRAVGLAGSCRSRRHSTLRRY